MTDSTTRIEPANGLRGLAQRRPLTTFLFTGIPLGYLLVTIWALAWHDQIPGGGLSDSLGIDPDEFAGALLILSLFPAALFVTHATGGAPAVRNLLRRSFKWRIHPGWWLAILIPLPAITVLGAVLGGDELRDVDFGALVIGQMVSLLINLFIINLWEETAWTGFFQTRLERRYGVFIAAAITAVPFGVVHTPLAFFNDELPSAAEILVTFVFFVILGLIVRPLLGVLRRGTLDSILAVGLMHSVFNRTNNDNGIAAELVHGDLREVTILIACIVTAVVIRIVFRQRMTKPFARELEARAEVEPVPATYR